VRRWQSQAAFNNAEWCDLVARAHGARAHFDSGWWASPDRTPPYYPDAVTLAPGTSASALLSQVDSSIGCSIKDSFADLDLTPYGFSVLFEAHWVVRSGGSLPPAPAGEANWRRAVTPDELAAWEAAWRGEHGPTDVFRGVLAQYPRVTVLTAHQGDEIVAGAIVSRSQTVVGISNVFVRPGEGLDPWPGCLRLASELSPGQPVVGYESGERLAQAESNGFERAGRLRVWLKDS
jgi:hypothetical protein